MGSVIDYLACPDCGSDAYNEFNYKSGEEFIMCNQCGYSRRFYIANMEEKDVKSEFGWIPDYKIEEVHGCGSYKIKPKGTIGYECGGFTEPAAAQEFVKLVKEREDEVEHAEYTTFIDGVLNRVVVIEGDLFKDEYPDVSDSAE